MPLKGKAFLAGVLIGLVVIGLAALAIWTFGHPVIIVMMFTIVIPANYWLYYMIMKHRANQ